MKMTSFDFVQLSCRLFSAAHRSICAISSSRDVELVDGTRRYVSSAYLKIRFPAVIGCKSAALGDTCFHLCDRRTLTSISLFVLTQLTNVTDGQTHRHRMTAWAALMHSIARQKMESIQRLQTVATNSAIQVNFHLINRPKQFYPTPHDAPARTHNLALLASIWWFRAVYSETKISLEIQEASALEAVAIMRYKNPR